jgi:hypothetical protein
MAVSDGDLASPEDQCVVQDASLPLKDLSHPIQKVRDLSRMPVGSVRQCVPSFGVAVP